MLPKQYRLTRSKDFARIRRLGRSSGNRLVVLYVLPKLSDETRVGFSVSKRVGKAVIRNRVKRRMREAVRHQVSALRTGQDLVFIARPASSGATYRQIEHSIAYALDKTGAVPQLTGRA